MRKLIFILALIIPAAIAFAAVPQTVSYQGYLTDSGSVAVSGPMSMTFRLYNVESGGTPLWEETQTVQVNNGIYAVALGAVSALDPAIIDGDLWLGVTVEADAEMAPRQKLQSTPYALRSSLAESLEGSVSQTQVAGLVDALAALQAQVDQLNKPKVQATEQEVFVSSGLANPSVCDTISMSGNGLTYSWSVLSQPGGSNLVFGSPSGCATAVTTDTSGEYQVQVTITDGAQVSTQTFSYQTLLNKEVTPSGISVATNFLMVPDGSGGAIVTWVDSHNGDQDIFAQRLDASGSLLWAPDGVAIVAEVGSQSSVQMVSDGSGGAFLVWMDQRSGNEDVYAQHIDGAGVSLWTPGGVAVATLPVGKNSPALAADGSGGLYVAWSDYRTAGDNADVYVQSLSGAGAPKWIADGIAVATATGHQQPSLISDGSGGVIVGWRTSYGSHECGVQKLDGSATFQWGAGGVVLTTDQQDGSIIRMIGDGLGGVIVDYIQTGSSHYMQRIDAGGIPQWGPGGIAVDAATDMIADGAGGVYIALHDYINANDGRIKVQRIDGSGAILWEPGGEEVYVGKEASSPSLATDGSGGVLVAWYDNRLAPGEMNADIYVQSLDGSGVIQWASEGVTVSARPSFQTFPVAVGDGSGGGLVLWKESSSRNAIYAQKILADGRPQY